MSSIIIAVNMSTAESCDLIVGGSEQDKRGAGTCHRPPVVSDSGRRVRNSTPISAGHTRLMAYVNTRGTECRKKKPEEAGRTKGDYTGGCRSFLADRETNLQQSREHYKTVSNCLRCQSDRRARISLHSCSLAITSLHGPPNKRSWV